jgi:hypothetical protein
MWAMPKSEIALVEREVPIKGTPEQVAMVLHAYEARGHLLSTDTELGQAWTRTLKYRGALRIGDEVVVRARLLMPPEPVRPERVGRKPAGGDTARAVRSALLFVGVCTASALFMIWLIVTAIGWALDRLNVTGTAVAGALIVAFLGWALLSARRGHPCVGLHCPGCPGH